MNLEYHLQSTIMLIEWSVTLPELSIMLLERTFKVVASLRKIVT